MSIRQVRNENSGYGQSPLIQQTVCKTHHHHKARAGLTDITNTTDVTNTSNSTNSTPVNNMNLALLTKRSASTAAAAVSVSASVPVPTTLQVCGQALVPLQMVPATVPVTAAKVAGAANLATTGSKSGELPLPTSSSKFDNEFKVAVSMNVSAGGASSRGKNSPSRMKFPESWSFSGVILLPPLDDFVSNGIGAYPSNYYHMRATREAMMADGVLSSGRACSSHVYTDSVHQYMERVRGRAVVPPLTVDLGKAIVTPKTPDSPEPEREWYSLPSDKSVTLSELKDVQERLAALERTNTELEGALVVAKHKCAQVDEVGAINDKISEVAQQLKQEVDAKEAELANMRSIMEGNMREMEILREATNTMEVMNTTLNEELATAHEMLDEAHDSEFSSPATCRSHESVHFDALTAEDQRKIKQDLLSSLEEEAQLKADLVKRLENELSAVKEQLFMQTEMLKSNRKQIAELETSQKKNSPDMAVEREQHKRLTELQVELQVKTDALQTKDSCIEAMKSELQDKEDELMTLLQSSIQSSELAAGKLSRMELQLADKTTNLNQSNQVNASFLRRQAEYENKEKELMQIQEESTGQIIELQQALYLSQEETALLLKKVIALEGDAKTSDKKIQDLGVSLKSAHDQHAAKVNNLKEKEVAYAATRKDLLKAKTMIAELEENVKTLKATAAAAASLTSRSPMFSQSQNASPFMAATPNGQNVSDIMRNSTPHASSHAHTAPSPLSSTISLLETQVLSLEQRCAETSAENSKLQERFESSQRQIENLTEEWQRSRASLERQLKMRSQSESELANKVCGLNEQLEQLMNYSMKLTGELTKSKENEALLAKQLQALNEEISLLRRQLEQESSPIKKQEVLNTILEKEREVEEWKTKAVHMVAEFEKATELLTKAKQSKIRRYNKYVSLQQDYRILVAQGERAASENLDLKQRHKVFVKTVEAALVGGEGKIALEKFKDKDTPTDSKNNNNRSLLNLSQELGAFDIPNPDFSDVDDDNGEEEDTPTRAF